MLFFSRDFDQISDSRILFKSRKNVLPPPFIPFLKLNCCSFLLLLHLTHLFHYSSLLPGEKCESSSVNLSTSRLSEEGVEGGAWEMSAADAATFNFNLTNSISYEVDLEPLTLCNSARVTFRWVKSAFMKERRKEWTNEGTNERRNERRNERTNEWTNEGMDERRNERRNERTKEWTKNASNNDNWTEWMR